MKPIRTDSNGQTRHAFMPTAKKAGQWVQTPSGFVRLGAPVAKQPG